MTRDALDPANEFEKVPVKEESEVAKTPVKQKSESEKLPCREPAYCILSEDL